MTIEDDTHVIELPDDVIQRLDAALDAPVLICQEPVTRQEFLLHHFPALNEEPYSTAPFKVKEIEATKSKIRIYHFILLTVTVAILALAGWQYFDTIVDTVSRVFGIGG